MSIVDRFLALGLPADQAVVIGSGILDALNLRTSGDIALVVSPMLFDQLRQSGDWQESIMHGEAVLTRDDAEVWQSWGSSGIPNFTELYAESVVVGMVHFANPRFVLTWKQQKARPKDLEDCRLLEGYLTRE